MFFNVCLEDKILFQMERCHFTGPVVPLLLTSKVLRVELLSLSISFSLANRCMDNLLPSN